MSAKFKNKDGQVSPYGFLCGHIQREEAGNTQLDLYADSCYHVRAYDFDEHERLTWESFETLGRARAYWKRCRKALREGKAIQLVLVDLVECVLCEKEFENVLGRGRVSCQECEDFVGSLKK